MARHNVLYLSSEVDPFVKVGGLADVASALPRALKEKEHDIRVLLPKYKVIKDRKYNLREVIRLRDINVPLGDEVITVSVKSGFLPDSKVQAYFLEYKPFYDRPDIYVNPKTGEGWEDNALRFALFSRTAFEMLKVLFWQPDVIHCNDWQSALVPYYMKTVYKDDPFFENIKTVLSIHNAAYQGEFDPEVAPSISADSIPFNEDHPAYHNGRFNFLKAGLLTADMLTTVSKKYAEEIGSLPEYGHGLEAVFKEKEAILRPVLNGIDSFTWNPETDKLLEHNYSIEEPDGKAENRNLLVEAFELDPDSSNMIIGMVSRLAYQKGFDLLEESADELAKLPVTFVILGTGQPDVEKMLKGLIEKYPDTFKVKFEFDNALAHLIEAGADSFLMPSRYEPCGLNQMYSLAYGTPPIVRETGGLADTVVDFNSNNGSGTGFTFKEYNAAQMVDAITRASEAFSDSDTWNKLRLRGMKEENSWMSRLDVMTDVYASVTAEVTA